MENLSETSENEISETSESELNETSSASEVKLPIDNTAKAESEQSEPKKRRTKMRYVGYELDNEYNGIEHEAVEYHVLEDLNGKRKRVNGVNYRRLKSSNLVAAENEDVYEVKSDKETGSIENKHKLIDADSDMTSYGEYIDNYKVMNSDGDTKWIDEEEYENLKSTGSMATKDEGFDFPEEPNVVERPEPSQSVFGRLRSVFTR